MSGKLHRRDVPFQIRSVARDLIIEFGDQAHRVARREAMRCVEANALVESKNWLEVADAVGSILPGRVTKPDI